MLQAYSLLLYLILPLVFLRLWWRGARVPGYREHWKERLGMVSFQLNAAPVWLHAVSVGEVRAAEPLVRAIQQRWPDVPLVVTTTSPTGRATVQQLFGDALYCAYLPWDLPAAVRRFVRNLRPRIAIVLETEIWPNLFACLDRENVPLLLVNARLSQKSLDGYRKLSMLVSPALGSVTSIAARGAQDAERFRKLGVDEGQLLISGDLKLDYHSPLDGDVRARALRGRIGERQVWVAGSTHAGEESMLLETHRRILRQHPGVLLVIAPRHTERSSQLVNLCRQAGLRYGLFSGPDKVADSVQVLILDVLGELVFLYGIALVAFIGGSLVERGGHNPVEAAVAGAALASGPACSNFTDIYQALTAAGAVKMVDGTAELAAFVVRCLDNPGYCRQQVEAAQQVINENRGAVKRTMALLEDVMPPFKPVGAVS